MFDELAKPPKPPTQARVNDVKILIASPQVLRSAQAAKKRPKASRAKRVDLFAKEPAPKAIIQSVEVLQLLQLKDVALIQDLARKE